MLRVQQLSDIGDKYKPLAALVDGLQGGNRAKDQGVWWIGFQKSQSTQTIDHRWACEWACDDGTNTLYILSVLGEWGKQNKLIYLSSEHERAQHALS